MLEAAEAKPLSSDSLQNNQSLFKQVPQAFRPQQFLYFFPEPQGHGSLRPVFLPPTTGFRFGFGAVEVVDPPDVWTYWTSRAGAACDDSAGTARRGLRRERTILPAVRASISWKSANDSRLKAISGSVPP